MVVQATPCLTVIKLTIASDGERCGNCTSRIMDSHCTAFDTKLILDRLHHHLRNPWLRCQPCLDAEVKDG